MMQSKHKMESHIHWKIDSRSCSFWWDNWLGVGPLAHFKGVSSRLDNTKVVAFIHNGQWDLQRVLNVAPPQHVTSILAMQLQIQQDVPDKALWSLNASGDFSIFSAWNIIREQRTKTKINKYTWNKHIPFKCSFLLWRALSGKLPTNEKLISFDHDPKEYCCYYNPSMDTIEHIFLTGHFVMNVWKLFAGSCGISSDHLPLHH